MVIQSSLTTLLDKKELADGDEKENFLKKLEGSRPARKDRKKKERKI